MARRTARAQVAGQKGRVTWQCQKMVGAGRERPSEPRRQARQWADDFCIIQHAVTAFRELMSRSHANRDRGAVATRAVKRVTEQCAARKPTLRFAAAHACPFATSQHKHRARLKCLIHHDRTANASNLTANLSQLADVSGIGAVQLMRQRLSAQRGRNPRQQRPLILVTLQQIA